MSSPNIIFLHYREIQKYPPALNLISEFNKSNIQYKLCTTTTNIKSNLINYFLFTIKALILLIRYPKAKILYYESISSLPVRLFYFLSPFSKRKLYIHFHEYFSFTEYKKQSRLERFGRTLEVKLFNKAAWISHTNTDRLSLFASEFPTIDKNRLFILPNFPPKSWLKRSTLKDQTDRDSKDPIRLLHIGAISIDNMFLEDTLLFFGNNRRFTIDFYSHGFSKDVIQLIKNFKNCKIQGSIQYEEIPKLFGKYDAGLVLYNGSSNNFIYNAPNKIFEYLALDLDVFCSSKLLTAKQYVRKNVYPDLFIIDFLNLKEYDFETLISKNNRDYEISPYHSEYVYNKFILELNAD